MDRSKQLSPNESDKVARHRNQMHEIALKKQISVIQKQGRILERELREISKVKQTLMQLRDPLRRRILQAQREEIEENEEVERAKQKASVLYGLPRQLKSRQGRPNKQTNNKKTTALMINGNGANINKTKQTADKAPKSSSKLFYKRRPSENNENISLPAIKNSNQSTNKSPESPSENLSRSESSAMEKGSRRLSLTAPQPFSKQTGQRFNDQDNTNVISGVEADRRPETSMTGALRRRSASFPQPPATSLGHRPRCEDFKSENTLTMEETLRIKGKFRQIGHSIIATALLKGLKQRGAATSEAIHNMHKPITVNEKKEETVDSQPEEKEKSGLEKFRKLTRKAINVNAVVSLKNENSNPVTTLKHDSTDKSKLSKRKLGIAGVAHAVKLSQAIEKSETRQQLMNEHTQNRRRKVGIAGIAHAAMITKAMNNNIQHNNEVSPVKGERSVRFKVDVWE